MEAPPREKRARAAFFREKDAKRAAKQLRKKEKLTEKIARGVAAENDVEPTCCSEAGVENVAVKQVEPFALGHEQRAGALLPLRILPILAGTPARDPMVGLSSEAGRAPMWQGYQVSWDLHECLIDEFGKRSLVLDHGYLHEGVGLDFFPPSTRAD